MGNGGEEQGEKIGEAWSTKFIENFYEGGTSYILTRVLNQLVGIRTEDEARRPQSATCHDISI